MKKKKKPEQKRQNEEEDDETLFRLTLIAKERQLGGTNVKEIAKWILT